MFPLSVSPKHTVYCYSQGVYMVFSVINGPDVISSVAVGVHRLHENTMPFYSRGLCLFRFWYAQGILKHRSTSNTKGR